MRSDSSSYLTSRPGATKVAGSNLTCPGTAPPEWRVMKPQGANPSAVKKVRACLPTTQLGSRREGAEPAEAHLTREKRSTLTLIGVVQKGGDHLRPKRRLWELPRCREWGTWSNLGIIRPRNVAIQPVTDSCALQTF